MLVIARLDRSFWVKTLMLMGTICRFSSTLRAVTTTSCRPPPEAPEGSAAAASASAGAGGSATPASAVATARAILEPRGSRADALGTQWAADLRLRERIRETPCTDYLAPRASLARIEPKTPARSSFEPGPLVNDRSTRIRPRQ